MTTTTIQRPETIRLADALKRRTPFLDGSSTIDHAEKELRRQNAEISSLTAELEKEHIARQEAQAMAECLDMLRTDLIAAGVVGPEVAPMFLTEAVLSAVNLERTALIAAQVENDALRAELAKARTPLEDYEWLEYILRNGSKSDVHIATYEGVATTGPRGKIIRLQHDANNLRKLVEAAYGIGEKP